MQNYIISFFVTRFFEENGVLIMYNWLNSENVRISDSNHPIYIYIKKGENGFINPFYTNGNIDDFEYLTLKKFLVISQKESKLEARKIYEESRNLKNLSIVLMPVEQKCNFECIYCHENHSKNSYMSEREIDIIEKFINKSKPNTFRVDYFGGEPLLNSKFIKAFNQKLINISENNKFDFLSSSMTTNGFFLNLELFIKLLNLKITTYQITLDGIKEFHDKYRPTINGRPTFERIYKNLVAISKLPRDKYFFSITIRMNFNKISASKEKRKIFFNKLKNDFGGDNRFIFMVQMISNWKEEVDNKDIYCTKEEGKQLQLEMEKELELMNLGTVPMVLFSNYGSNSCYSGNPNNLIIYPINDEIKGIPIEKCTLSINNPINNSGYIDYNGNIHKSKQWYFWTKYSLFKYKKCDECFFVLNCWGKSCNLNNFKQNDIICPEHKFHEVSIVKRILDFIQKG